MNLSSARKFFHHEIQQPDEYIDLAKAALYIAQEEYSELDIEEYLNALDAMAIELEERLPLEKYPLKIIQCINKYLYDDLNFTGNTQNYYDPRNSFLNDVIERRIGIPITLALLYIEIARRIDFPMIGIGMPGHFLIRPNVSEIEIFVDAFNSGEVLFPQDCQQRLSQIYQQNITLQPEFLAPVTKKQFLARMLTNLKYIYLKQHESEKALFCVERILLLFPSAALELRDRGLLSYQIGRFNQAADDLQAYLMQAPDAQDASTIRQLLAKLGKNQ
ncbi:SirB1 family protein [Calothrix sp. CCY 0018]|uniref:SirB1 family protein n=1 Tax=Calothrix sp. CCY 0018 TaxID=3103864 RepID=UPI0039C6ADAE